MPLVVPITPTNLPNPPSTESPDDFDAKADAFLGALPNNQSELNQLTQATYTNAQYANEQATSAAASASTATSAASSAEASAVSASTAGNASKWSAATSYGEGVAAWSPVDYQTYRKITPGTSTTGEPTVTPNTWRLIGVSTNHLFNMTIGVY